MHPCLSYYCPQPVVRDGSPVRLERFPRSVHALLKDQFGPLANLRSSAGCGVFFATDSPWVELQLARLRHHQMASCGVAIEVQHEDGWRGVDSADLREREGDLTVRLPTGLERGGPVRPVVCWLPLISTVAFAGLAVAEGAQVEAVAAPAPTWLALGDSLTQGFIAQSPLAAWPHRLMRAWDAPGWNLGVGGLRIEPEAVAWALAAQRWPLVIIALGSNHCWKDADVATVAPRAEALARLALAGGHGQVVWCLPPWKPCEDGKGPPEFAGVPLDRSTAARIATVRATLREVLSSFPAITLVEDLMPHDHRVYPDGLHPTAFGLATYAAGLLPMMTSRLRDPATP